MPRSTSGFLKISLIFPVIPCSAASRFLGELDLCSKVKFLISPSDRQSFFSGEKIRKIECDKVRKAWSLANPLIFLRQEIFFRGNSLQIRCKSPANPLQIRCKSAANKPTGNKMRWNERLISGMATSHRASALGELELDAPVARLRVFAVAGIERLKFAEARRHQMLGADTAADEIVDDRDRARR
jgi:hypothetical protein